MHMCIYLLLSTLLYTTPIIVILNRLCQLLFIVANIFIAQRQFQYMRTEED